ncbi:unnamed protein product [Rhizoctonia solani]|uniref:Protein transport protein SFT2 n=1 Tax=Rhizoctonia solani TaxID=456999 RepID=A0A8H3DFV0_9AGAM|nr:unnamed protein product [Rhizoctonia solani]
MPKGWLNLEGVTDTQVFENEPAFNFGLSRTQRLYGFVGCLAIGFVLSILGSCLLFLGALGSFALLYTIGIVVSLIGTGFLIGFGKQLQLMFKPVRVVATIIFLATIGLVFVGAFVIKIAVLCLIFVIIEYLAYTWNNSASPFCIDIKPRCGNKWQNRAGSDEERIMSTPGLWQAPNGQGNPDGRPLPPGFVTQFDTRQVIPLLIGQLPFPIRTLYNAWFYINTQANPPRSQWLHPADHADQSNPPPGGINWNALAPAGATPGDRGYGGGYGPGPGPAYGQGGYNPNMQQGYGPPPIQQKSSSNTGAIVAAGAAGVVGGALIANAMSDDDYQDGYEAGLEAAEEDN